MEGYNEYFIRCLTCGNLIACRSQEYLSLVASGESPAGALDLMGYKNYCCRIAMMNPIFVLFDMENREAIEGVKDVAAVKGPSKAFYPVLSGNFEACLSNRPIVKNMTKNNEKLENLEPLGQGIPLNIVLPKSFQKPRVPGMPVINEDNTVVADKVYAGSDHWITVLTGRTYITN